ncbi:MAG TPA: zf-HC2 domain-containing protein [Ktedonobacterales bacterium]
MVIPDKLSCQELIEMVTEYVEGTMPAAERARFEAHLSTCHGCRTYVAQMRRTIQLAGRLAECDLPDDAKEQLLRAFRTWKRRS